MELDVPDRELDIHVTSQMWDHVDIQKVRDVAWSAIRYNAEQPIYDAFGSLEIVRIIHQMLKQRNQNREAEYRGAALLCGDMVSERVFFEHNDLISFRSVDGFDVSSLSMARYQPKNIEFFPYVLDCNDLNLEQQRYDFIVCINGAYHIYNLGNLFYQCHKALKPGGLIYIYEWIGPPYLQIPRQNHIIATLCLWGLFSRAVRTTHMGKVKGRWLQYPPDAFEPSEACNSTELLPQFLRYFRPLVLGQFGGLMYPVFEGIGHRFNQNHRFTRVRIKAIYQIERALTRLGLVKPLFAVSLAEKHISQTDTLRE